MSDLGGDLAARPVRTLSATDVLAGVLRGAEQRGLRGEPAAALRDLARVRPALGSATPSALRAVAECSALLALWGGDAELARTLCDAALAGTDDAAARGRILLCRARITAGPGRREAYTAALTEFSAAGDAGGQALALAGLAFPRADDTDGIGASYQLKLARDALRLAAASGEEHAIAVCLGNLAAGETYLGRTSTVRRWQRAAERMPADLDTYTAEAMSLNYVNWALVAAGHGEYAVARRAVVEGRALARGVAWARTFTAIEALVAWRTGAIDTALAAADRVLAGRGSGQARERGTAMATVLTVAASFERERRPDVTALAEAVRELGRESDQLGATALALQARIRAGRREPHPHRGLLPALAATATRGRRFGWEDLAMALADVDRAAATAALPPVGACWPRGPRGSRPGCTWTAPSPALPVTPSWSPPVRRSSRFRSRSRPPPPFGVPPGPRRPWPSAIGSGPRLSTCTPGPAPTGPPPRCSGNAGSDARWTAHGCRAASETWSTPASRRASTTWPHWSAAG